MRQMRFGWGLGLLLGCNGLLGIDEHGRDTPSGGGGGVTTSAGRGGSNTTLGGGGTKATGATAGIGAGGEFGGAGGAEERGGTTGLGEAGGGGVPNGHGGVPTSAGRGNSGSSGAPSTGGGSNTSSGGAGFSTGGSKATSGGTSPASGGTSPASGGTSTASGGVTAAGGSIVTNACVPACQSPKLCEEGVCVDCRNTERSCASDGTPLLCTNRAWVKQSACSGATSLCVNGTCVGKRLIGGVVNVAGALVRSDIRLVKQSINFTAPSCSTAAGKCVLGGIRP